TSLGQAWPCSGFHAPCAPPVVDEKGAVERVRVPGSTVGGIDGDANGQQGGGKVRDRGRRWSMPYLPRPSGSNRDSNPPSPVFIIDTDNGGGMGTVPAAHQENKQTVANPRGPAGGCEHGSSSSSSSSSIWHGRRRRRSKSSSNTGEGDCYPIQGRGSTSNTLTEEAGAAEGGVALTTRRARWSRGSSSSCRLGQQGRKGEEDEVGCLGDQLRR
ncbi:unnamed protein product, partial [Discosporangium mesarthrocarpum]